MELEPVPDHIYGLTQIHIRLDQNLDDLVNDDQDYSEYKKFIRSINHKTHNIDNLILSQTRKPIPPKKQQPLSVGFEPTILYQRNLLYMSLMVRDAGLEPTAS